MEWRKIWYFYSNSSLSLLKLKLFLIFFSLVLVQINGPKCVRLGDSKSPRKCSAGNACSSTTTEFKDYKCPFGPENPNYCQNGEACAMPQQDAYN